MDAAAVQGRRIWRIEAGSGNWTDDELAVEEPLEIRVGTERKLQPLSITMRTPGKDPELAAGFLFTEGVLMQADEIVSIEHARHPFLPQPDPNVVEVVLKPDHPFDPASLNRHFYTTSSCGVCGKSSVDALRTTAGRQPFSSSGVQHSPALLGSLPEHLREIQQVFGRTGGLHASALFSAQGECLWLREDVGRHNALDKLIGASWLAGALPQADDILLLSGRASFELLQKAIMAGIRTVAAVGAPSSLAVELAAEFHVTLVGFLRPERMNVYTAPERIVQA
jgi:FdhD protein